MNNIVTVQQVGALSTRFANAQGHDELGAGISSGFAVIGYKGKVWSIKHGGVDTPLMREDGDGARGSIEVVMLKASPVVSKVFYEGGYQEGSNSPPQCWSTNGTTPDASVPAPQRQHPNCASCPKNAWGSRTTEQGKNAKACADSKRVAVVPLGDLKNELYGGPMLLRVPAATLRDLKQFGEALQGYGYVYFGVGTRIGFATEDAYPHFTFTAMRPLTDGEAEIVIEMRDSDAVKRILSESIEIQPPADGAQTMAEPPKSIFESGAGAKATAPAATVAASKPAAATKPAVKPAKTQPQATTTARPATATAAPASKPVAQPAATKPTPQPAVAPKPAAPKPAVQAAKPPVQVQPAPVEEVQAEEAQAETGEEVQAEEGAEASPGGFDEMLDDLLK